MAKLEVSGERQTVIKKKYGRKISFLFVWQIYLSFYPFK